MSRKQGQTVNLGLVANPASTAAVNLGIFDSNGAVRTLQPWERLLIDALEGTVTTGTVDIATTSTVASSTLIASFNTAVGLDLDSGEGYSCPIGLTPFVLAGTSTAVVKISGVGRIINGSTQGVRAGYRELLTPGGNF